MAKSDAARSAEWRRRLLLKSSIFDDLNAERAARIRQAFPDDDRPEVRAVVEFFANYPRCQVAPDKIDLQNGMWCVDIISDAAGIYESTAAFVALSEVTSLPVGMIDRVEFDDDAARDAFEQHIRNEVAELRALGLWGRQ